MTQFRADEGLAFMLQYENVAWYDAGEVRILDRRIYPAKIEFVRCKTHVEVMQAIRDMVTQSAGPVYGGARAWRWPHMSAGKNRQRSSCAFCRRRTKLFRTRVRPRTSG